MAEQRKNMRLNLESELLLKRLDGEGGNSKVQISIKDVSKSGIGFSCPEKLDMGAVYECNLTIWTKEVIHSFIEIVRVSKAEDGSFNYGGIFIGMPETDVNRIAVYCKFEEEGLH